jgi:hypothetical protein
VLADRRAIALRDVLAACPELLVVEDDRAGDVTGGAAHTLTTTEAASLAADVAALLAPGVRTRRG